MAANVIFATPHVYDWGVGRPRGTLLCFTKYKALISIQTFQKTTIVCSQDRPQGEKGTQRLQKGSQNVPKVSSNDLSCCQKGPCRIPGIRGGPQIAQVSSRGSLWYIEHRIRWFFHNNMITLHGRYSYKWVHALMFASFFAEPKRVHVEHFPHHADFVQLYAVNFHRSINSFLVVFSNYSRNYHYELTKSSFKFPWTVENKQLKLGERQMFTPQTQWVTLENITQQT